ncbi:rhodanese-like domain-containing protein [Gayadomonas joobiniege]|uniref:rhodanese-like domain-containing protein n=1 Tax=Gayadomonas joobiniege TaxID=1234606 RepID=UPI0004744EDB|nr:rhodanese-like domain-containing protein [Gayadomonas joobiniege]
MPFTAAQLVADVRLQIPSITCAELAENKADFLLIDIRSATELKAGYIEGAHFIDRGLLEFKIAQLGQGQTLTDKLNSLYEQQICLYCKSDGRSVLATEQMQRMGFSRVFSLAGGFDCWQKNKYPVVKHD